jgi:hypothetical protein
MVNKEEKKILTTLDTLVRREENKRVIDLLTTRILEKLARESESVLVWETIDISLFGEKLPETILSSWIFGIRSRSISGAERHPRSHQRMMSYRGSGDLQVWDGSKWESHLLKSESSDDIEKRWISIKPKTWHQVVVGLKDWIVISFHTVLAEELIEERPDKEDFQTTHSRKYIQ